MREKIVAAMKAAMKSKDEVELSTLRLMNAAIKAKDIDLRSQSGSEDEIGDDEIITVLAKMVKQRQDSVESYMKAKRKDLADRELLEIRIISRFLPKPLTEEETLAAVTDAVAETGASSIKDMGKVVAVLKEKYAGQLDVGSVSSMIKAQLNS